MVTERLDRIERQPMMKNLEPRYYVDPARRRELAKRIRSIFDAPC
jgi:hypothetical protein